MKIQNFYYTTMDQNSWKLLEDNEVKKLPEKALQDYSSWLSAFKEEALRKIEKGKETLMETKVFLTQQEQKNTLQSEQEDIEKIKKNLSNE